MRKKGAGSYWNTDFYDEALASKPNVVLILLGTNDAYGGDWDELAFQNDYLDFIKSFRTLMSRPQVYLLVPPRTFGDFPGNVKMHNGGFSRLIPIIAG